jgi:hypothetical protein
MMPMLIFDIRVVNNWGRNIKGGMGSFELSHSQNNTMRLASNGWFTVWGIAPKSSTRFRLKVPLTLETIHQIDKAKPSKEDVNLSFNFSGFFFTPDPGQLMFQFSEIAPYRVSSSDWTKFVSPWTAIEVQVSPEPQKKVEKPSGVAMRPRKLGDIIDDFDEEELERKKRD